MATKDPKPTAFISFNSGDASFVDSLEEKAQQHASIIRYENGVSPWGRFKAFMDTIKEQDFAVLVISDAYLKSRACMYEVMTVMQNANWTNTTMFVVMSGTSIYSNDGRLCYITYWSEQFNKLSEALAGLPETAIRNQREELQQIEKIRDSIGGFLSIVSDAKNPAIWDAIDAICDKLSMSRGTRFMYHLSEDVKVNVKQAMILLDLEENSFTRNDIQKRTQLSPSEVRYHLDALISSGLVREVTNQRVVVNGSTRIVKTYALTDHFRKLGA